jgi:spermidine dehydrogenase
MNKEDRELGMGRAISRRDFVQGIAVATAGASALGGASSALAQAAAAPPPSPTLYPPLRTGLRGAHPGAFEDAHALRDGQAFSGAQSTGEVYDLVVVGGGLSGLASAVWYRKEAGPAAKILVLDNHDDFGGHAKRNEFWYKGQQYLANGGSSYLVAPPQWENQSKTFLDDLGVDWKNPGYARTARMQSSQKLGPATYFNKKHYGKDQLVVGGSYEDPTPEYMAKTPLTPQMRAEVIRLFTGKTDYLSGLSKEDKVAKLRSMTYRDYLINVAKFSPEIIGYSGGAWCLGADMCTAWFAFFRYSPGFAGLGLDKPHFSPEGPEHRAIDYNWICGNSDLARLMVRMLIPDSLPAGPWLSVEGQRADYSTLDRPSNATRLRVSSIVVGAKHIGAPGPQFEPEGREVLVSYMNGGKLVSVVGKHVIMAGMNNVIPYLCPDMPDPQKAALHQAVRAVNQQTNVLFRNWESFAKLGVNRIGAPHNFFGTMSMGGGTLVGDMAPIKDPSQPMLVGFGTGGNSGVLSNNTMASELCDGMPPALGTPIDDQFRIVRMGMLTKDFAFWERQIRTMAAGALSGTNFDPARDIVAITVNRWPHGFATGRSTLEDDPTQISPTIIAKQRFGNIAIANSDAAGTSLAQSAIQEAYRAVQDLKPKAYGFYEYI